MNNKKKSFGYIASSVFSKYGIYFILLILVVVCPLHRKDS